MNRLSCILLLLLVNAGIIMAQPDTAFTRRTINYAEYIDLVKTKNLEYAAEKFNVRISEAAIQAAKVFPDPYISADLNESREAGLRAGYGYSAEVGTTVEIGGKRKARIDLASSENELSKAQLADYFRNLRADATLAYLEAMKQKQIYQVALNSYLSIQQLADADSIRYSLGSIKRIDATQSRLEAGNFYNDLLLALAGWKNSLSEITLMTGSSDITWFYHPQGNVHDTCRLFSIDELIDAAVRNRSDLVAAMHNIAVSEKSLKLARRERIADIGIRMGTSNSYVSNGGASASSEITGGIEIPLKLSNLSKGEIRMAEARVGQSEELYRLAEAQIRTEIIQSWNTYYAYCRQVDNFDYGLLRMASEVLKGKIYSYQRGENSLLEVLYAQRTYNEIQTSYYEALYNRSASLVNLERSAGIWDIDF